MEAECLRNKKRKQKMSKEKKTQMFEGNNDDFIELDYATDYGLRAKELGESILGMQVCINEIAKIAKVRDFELFAIPELSKNLKIRFELKGATSNTKGIIIRVLTESLRIMQEFGVDMTFNLRKEVISSVTDPKVLAVCNSRRFIENVQKIIVPISATNISATVSCGDQGLKLSYEGKESFFEELREKEVLPKMQNGKMVKLTGEITRINKEYNDIGLRYQDRILRCILPDRNREISQFHDFIRENQVLLEGIVERKDKQETPKVKIVSIARVDEKEQAKLFF